MLSLLQEAQRMMGGLKKSLYDKRPVPTTNYQLLTTTGLFTMAMVSCLAWLGAQEKQSFISEKIRPVWETSRVLKTPESVLYDPDRKLLYVSNVNGRPTEKDGNGFISRLTLEGKIQKLQWSAGMDAPKGMGLSKNRLYVADIDQVVAIDPEIGTVIRRFKADGAKFLNDVTVDDEGSVFISDMQTNRIYRLKDEKLEVWMESEDLDKPNGILAEKGRLLVGTRNHILLINTETKEMKVHIYNTGGIDGLVPAGDNYYLITDWQGTTQRVHLLEDKEVLMDTKPDSINAADLEYIMDEKLMLIPTFNDNRVRAFRVEE